MLEKRGVRCADLYDWDELVQEDRVHRLIYTDPAIFAAEMINIFGAVWVYLGHESQIPRNDDFITVRLGLRPGRVPVILIRPEPRPERGAPTVRPLRLALLALRPQGDAEVVVGEVVIRGDFQGVLPEGDAVAPDVDLQPGAERARPQ